MKILTEKGAEKLLKKESFSVTDGFYIRRKSELKNKVFNFSYVAKASGKKIIHKKKLGGIMLNIDSVEKAEKAYEKFKKIEGLEEVFFQKQLKTKEEFLLGIKNTPEFGHTIVFGVGGSGVEQKKDFAFRIYPFDVNDAEEMINETIVGKNLSKKDTESVKKEILKILKLIKKYPKIKELDINPLMIEDGICNIVDARIVFD